MPSNSFFDWTASLSRFVRFDAARAEDVNAALDEATAGFDGVEIKTNAAIKLPDGETAAALPAVASRKGMALSFDDVTGAPEAVLAVTEVIAAQGYATSSAASAAAASASASAASSSASAASGSASAASASALAAAGSAALCSSAAINTLNSRTYFFFTM